VIQRTAEKQVPIRLTFKWGKEIDAISLLINKNIRNYVTDDQSIVLAGGKCLKLS